MGSISRTGRVTIDIISKLAEFIQHHKKIIFALILWGGILMMVRTTMAINDLSLTELADVFVYILRNAWYGLLFYIVLYIIRPLLLMPGTLLNFMAGMVYGFPFGFVMVIIAHLCSATTTYTVSRWVIHEPPQFDGRTNKLVTFLRRNPFEAMMTMQLTYISLDFTSSLAGILHLPYRLFILGLLVGGFVGNGLGVFIGSSIQGSISNGTITMPPEMIMISVSVFLLSMGISTILRRRNRDILSS